MKIMVCLKQVPHQDARLDISADGTWIAEDSIKFEINSYDTYALEEALRVKDAGEADVLVPTVTDRIDAAVIGAAGPGLRIIANFGVGVDHIDLAAAEKKNIAVTNTPDVLTEDTADLAMALILAAPRRLASPSGPNGLGLAPTGGIGATTRR